MFEVNDYVVYGLTGVCQIIDIQKNQDTDGNETDYYVLRPVYDNTNNMIIKTPVSLAKIRLRRVISEDDATSLIARMPEFESIWIDDTKKRSAYFKAILKTAQCEDYIKVLKTLRMEKKARSVMGKNITHTDENIMKTAEKQLHDEFAIALNISPHEVAPYILEHIS